MIRILCSEYTTVVVVVVVVCTGKNYIFKSLNFVFFLNNNKKTMNNPFIDWISFKQTNIV